MNASVLENLRLNEAEYVVTGAAGHLGSTLLRLLRDNGCSARCLLLNGEAPVVESSRFRYFYGDVRKAGTLRPLFENSERREQIVLHTAALISIDREPDPFLRDVNVLGTKNILRLCREFSVKRLVYVCSVHAIPEPPAGVPATEPLQFAVEAVEGGYAKTKAEAAQAVRNAAIGGLDAVTVFPSGIIGPYDDGRNHLVQLARKFIDGRLPACVRGGFDFVDVRDVAIGCLLAAHRGRSVEGYILNGRYASIHELLSMIGRSCNRKAPYALPVGVAKSAVPLIRLAAKLTGKRPLYTRYSLDTLAAHSHFSSAKAQAAFAYTPRSLEETTADMVAWLKRGDVGEL